MEKDQNLWVGNEGQRRGMEKIANEQRRYIWAKGRLKKHNIWDIFHFKFLPLKNDKHNTIRKSNISLCTNQGGITCEAIDEPRKSSYAIDERVIINFCDKNVVIARFRDKNVYQ